MFLIGVTCLCLGSDGIMYSDLGCGLFTAQIEATSTSSPPTKFTLDLQQIAIPCSSNCTEAETTPLQGTASVTVNAPNAIININLNGPAILSCRLNNGPLSPCKKRILFVKIYFIEIFQVMITLYTEICLRTITL